MSGNENGGKDGGAVRTRRGMTTLGQSIGRVTTPAMRRRGFAEAAIITDWPTIVGRPLSDHTQPSRIVFARGTRAGGTLHLLVTGAFAPDVQHLAPVIVERINGHFGYGAIARIELHQTRLTVPDHGRKSAEIVGEPPPELAEAIAKVADERLKSALGRLARARAGAESRARAGAGARQVEPAADRRR